MLCNSCPRNCNTERNEKAFGYCKMPSDIYISKYMLHPYEEPCISYNKGAGTIFFTGCNLKCVYCQNKDISRGNTQNAFVADKQKLIDIITELENQGAECIEFVTPTHYIKQLIPILKIAKEKTDLPFVWNCGGYEKVEYIKELCGLIDIYMPDMKYFSSEISKSYSNVSDYYEVALPALKEMIRQTGSPMFNNGKLMRGVIIRHLVLPSCKNDSIDLLNDLSKEIDVTQVILSLMSQYTPEFYKGDEYKNLKRRVTTYEYNCVLKEAIKLGYDGYFQSRDSANKKYTPSFSTNDSFNE